MGSSASKVLSGGTLMRNEWRQMMWDEQTRSSLLQAIKEYKPLSQVGVADARILLLGPVNVGKSSFFNTINSIFRNHVTAQAPVGSPMDQASITTRLRAYQIRDGREGKVLNFKIVDTMGLEEERKQGLDPSELSYVLDGHVPENHQFDNKGNISQEMPGYIKLPKLSDKIHCCVIVLDANSIATMGDGILTKLADIRGKITARGIPMIVLLTKIDKACPQTATDVSLVYKSVAIQNIVTQASVKIGVPVSYVLPIKNYTHEIELDPWVDVLALSAVQQMLRFTDNYFDECLSTSGIGYVKPEKSSGDMWTQKSTLPSSQRDQTSIFSPDVITASTAVVTGRMTNGVDGNLLYHQRLIAEGIRGSPRFNNTAIPPKEDSPPPPPPLSEDAEYKEDRKLDEQVAELLEVEDTPTREKVISESPPIPGVVPQEAA